MHPGTYQFIETSLAGKMWVDPGGFECCGKFSKINNTVGCGEIHQDAGGNILYNSYSRESLWDAAGCNLVPAI